MLGKPWPVEYLYWSLAERYGWTPDTVDRLSLGDLADRMEVLDGMAKARSFFARKK